ncbi:hypothetical protein GCM10010174_08990 [Kutzneria viridogrisea]|uniref:Uncharacterized protein n=1 Tax=Kutzneria viridogrisea TaxID=47990 RepID=A0ABR6BY00_9PSEU|nr:hypothetical protein [Kutzneria albida]MBA8931462.1 hypothetical protein [Kutzneria viridogrisea]
MAEYGNRGGPRVFTLLIGLVGLLGCGYALTDGAVERLPFGPTGLLAGAALLVGVLILAWTVRPGSRGR